MSRILSPLQTSDNLLRGVSSPTLRGCDPATLHSTGQALLHAGHGPVDVALHAGRRRRPALPQQALPDRPHGDEAAAVHQDRAEHAVARRADEAFAVLIGEAGAVLVAHVQLVEGAQEVRGLRGAAVGGQEVGQVGAHVEQAGLRGRLTGAERAQASAGPALGDRAHERDTAPGRLAGTLRPGRGRLLPQLDGVLQGAGGLRLGQCGPAGQVLGADRAVAGRVAVGDVRAGGAVAGPAVGDVGPCGPGVGVGQVACVHDEVLVAGPRPLDEDPLALEAH